MMMVSSSLALFWLLLVAVGAMRLIELRISRAHQRDLAARGATRIREPRFGLMVGLHTAILIGAGLEATIARRPLLPALAAICLLLVVAAIALRLWVIRSLGQHWNVQIVDSVGLGVVTAGPFRFVRHPNYVAVFVELLALPLVHTAWITALAGALAHLLVLRARIAAEEDVLMAHPAYRAAMGGKPRFVPRLGRAA
jgi:methyltransferase